MIRAIEGRNVALYGLWLKLFTSITRCPLFNKLHHDMEVSLIIELSELNWRFGTPRMVRPSSITLVEGYAEKTVMWREEIMVESRK